MYMHRWHYLILLIVLVGGAATNKNGNCSIPRASITRRDGRVLGSKLGGFIDVPQSEKQLFIVCESFDPEHVDIDLQYIEEETLNPVRKTENEVNRNKYKIWIKHAVALINGSSYGQYFCIQRVAMCGFVEILIYRDHTIQMITHQDGEIPEFKTERKTSKSWTEKRTFLMEFSLTKANTLLEAACRIDKHSIFRERKITLGDIEILDINYGYEANAYLRNHFTTHSEEPYKVNDCQESRICESFSYSHPQTFIFRCRYENEFQDGFVLPGLPGGRLQAMEYFYNTRSEDVKSLFLISQHPKSAYEGEDVEITCTFSSIIFVSGLRCFANSTSIEWIEIDIRKRDRVAKYGLETVKFLLSNISISDNYKVRCSALQWRSNSFTNAELQINIKELPSPLFEKPKEFFTIRQNQFDNALYCSAISSGKTSYVWSLPQKLQNDSGINIATNETGSLLLFTNGMVKGLGTGIFHCISTNFKGNATKTYEIELQDIPIITIWYWVGLYAVIGALLLLGIYNVRQFWITWNSEPEPVQDCITITLDTMHKEQSVWSSDQPLELTRAEPIGSGSFANVYSVRHTVLDKLFALKKINVYKALQHLNWDIQHVLMEMKNLSDINHDHVVKFHGCWLEGPCGLIREDAVLKFQFHEWTSSQNYSIFMQMELCDSTLHEWLTLFPNMETRMMNQDIREIFLQISSGLRALHSRNIIHRDIKPNNIFYLVVQGGYKKWMIGDLGLSTNPKDSQTSAENDQMTVIGCTMYRSPEMGNGGKYTFKSDVFTLGLVFLEVIHCFGDFKDKLNMFDYLRNVEADKPITIERFIKMFRIPSDLSIEAALVSKMLRVEDSLRPNSDELAF